MYVKGKKVQLSSIQKYEYSVIHTNSKFFIKFTYNTSSVIIHFTAAKKAL